MAITDDDAQQSTPGQAGMPALATDDDDEPATMARPRRGAVAGTKKYEFMTTGGQPPEQCSITLDDKVYRAGDSLSLTEGQHEALTAMGHIFKEDIVQTEGSRY